MLQDEDLLSSFNEKRWPLLVVIQFVAFAGVGIYATWAQRYLYADGSHFLMIILQGGQVTDFDPFRYFSHYLTQIPAVLLIQKFDCHDIKLLAAVYGATQLLLPLVGLLVSWWAARKARPDYLVYPLISCSIIYLNVSYFSISESLIAVSLFFPMLYLLVFSERLNFVRSFVLLGLAVAAVRSYECYFFLAWVLLFVAARRGRLAAAKKQYGELFVCTISCLLFLAAFCVSACSVLFPCNTQSRTNFVLSSLVHLISPPVWFSLLLLVGIVWCLLLPDQERGWRRIRNAVWLCGLLVMLLPVGGIVVPPLQYAARIQCLYVPLLLGVIVVWKAAGETSSARPARHAELWSLAAVACLVATTFQLGATARWDGYRSLLLRELSERRGVIAFDQSVVYNSLFDRDAGKDGRPTPWEEFIADPAGYWGRLKLAQHHWGWALPSLTVSLGALNLGSISSIICAPEFDGWQPFDPYKPEAVPDLRPYGIPTDVSIDR